jgi:ElaA protein
MNTFSSRPTNDIRWRWGAFDALTLRELQYIHMARQQVFVIEQNCPYLDADERDERSHHLAAWSAQHPAPLAYARLVEPGMAYPEPSMGRVITTAPGRGLGLGRELVRRVIAHAAELYPGQGIRISAQSQLEAFYAEAGFAVVSERYLEDGIPHTEMLLAPSIAIKS